MGKEKGIEYWQASLEEDLRRWRQIKENGCSDPFWPDGVNLNLVRNHIINALRNIEELSGKPMQMSLFDVGGLVSGDFMKDPRIPPKVDNYFMAKPREGARYLDIRGV